MDPNPRFILFLKHGNGNLFFHNVLLLSTGPGERFIVDPTGSQFSFADWFWTYEEYIEHNTLQQAPTLMVPNTTVCETNLYLM